MTTDQYLDLLDETDPALRQGAYIAAVMGAMPPMTQQQRLDAAIAVVRRYHPDAARFDVAHLEFADDHRGFILQDVTLHDGTVLVEDEQIMPVYNATWPLLQAITWDGVIPGGNTYVTIEVA